MTQLPFDGRLLRCVERRAFYLAALALACALATIGCRTPETPAAREATAAAPSAADDGPTAAVEPSPVAGAVGEDPSPDADPFQTAPAPPPADFAPATPRQRELLQSAMGLVAIDELDAAAVYLLTILQEPPASLEKLVATLVLAEVYNAEERYDRGIARVERQAALLPPTAELNLALATLYQGAGRAEDARSALRRAAGIAPERLDVLSAWVHAEADGGLAGEENPGLAQASQAYEAALPLLVERLQGADPEEIAALLQTVGPVRDERLTAPLLGLLGHSDLGVVGAALETLVNGGYASVAPRLRQAAEVEAREQVRQGLTSAADFLESAPAPENLREMPFAVARKSGD